MSRKRVQAEERGIAYKDAGVEARRNIYLKLDVHSKQQELIDFVAAS